MSEILDDIAYLSQEIGPRPAGTEEEQQAALYITEQLQKRAGLPTEIEDFACNAQADILNPICFGIPLILAIGAFFQNILVIPAFIVALAGAVLFALEAFGKPVLSRLFERGVSQNVVAKYTPDGDVASKRARKIVLVANYDSGKIQKELKVGLLSVYPIIQKACLYALIALPVLLLVRGLVFLNATGVGALVVCVATIVDLIIIAIPVILFFVHRVATYNEAANSNGAGVAVLMETARRVVAAREAAEQGAMQEPQIYGEEAARREGLVPDQAQIEYEARVSEALDEPVSSTGRLAAAKAAVAALTGQPVREYAPAPSDISGRLVQVRESSPKHPDASQVDEQRKANIAAFTGVAGQPTMAPAADEPRFDAGYEPSIQREPVGETAAQIQYGTGQRQEDSAETPVPDWFRVAQEKASKPHTRSMPPVKRSRYADALDAAVAMSSQHFEQANRAIDKETEERLQKMRDGIVEVQAPTVGMEPAQADIQGTQPMQPIEHAHIPVETHRDNMQMPPAAQQAMMDEPHEQLQAYAQQPSMPRTPIERQPREATPVAQQQVAQPSGSQIRMTEAVEPVPNSMMPVVQPVIDPGTTTSMPPLDVSDLRAAAAASRQEAARALQGRPSQHVTPAPRREVERVVYDETEESAQDAVIERAQRNIQPQPAVQPLSMPQRQQSAPLHDQASAAPVVLPDIGNSNLPPIGDLAKQRAPLAEVGENSTSGQPTSALLSGRIPRINLDALPSDEARAIEAMPDNKWAALRNSIPSMSGSISMESSASKESESSAVSMTGSFAPVAATGTVKPVGDELVANMDPSEMYVEDADDSSYDVDTTETGAFAGPGYMDMPKKRHGLFGRFRKNKKKAAAEEQSASDWLNIDDNFSATKVGAARGGWESFREDSPFEQASQPEESQTDRYVDDGFDDYVDDGYNNGFDDDYIEDGYDDDDNKWKGGAFSKIRSKAGRGSKSEQHTSSGESSDFDEAETTSQRSRGAARVERIQEVADMGVSAEVDQIYEFRNAGGVDVEVWFVALGSELSGNAGMKAFLREHAQELRGSVIVNLEALGAGKLSFIESEGAYVSKKPSSRMKRYLKKAGQTSGVSAAKAKMEWRDSAASLAMKHGLQAMSLVGMDGGKPAMMAQGDDVLENIDAETLDGSADFVMGIIAGA